MSDGPITPASSATAAAADEPARDRDRSTPARPASAVHPPFAARPAGAAHPRRRFARGLALDATAATTDPA